MEVMRNHQIWVYFEGRTDKFYQQLEYGVWIDQEGELKDDLGPFMETGKIGRGTVWLRLKKYWEFFYRSVSFEIPLDIQE